MPRPDPTVHTDHPDELLDIDAGGNCRAPGCGYNSDAAYDAALSRGEDVYGTVPDDDIPVEVWCGQWLRDRQRYDHLASCSECRAVDARLAADGPPGYSAGIAELGYDGDG